MRIFVYHFFAALFALVLMLNSARALDLKDYVLIAPPDGWVVPQVLDDLEGFAEGNKNQLYLLVDFQTKYTKNNEERFVHTIEKLNTPVGVENNSTVHINFDPSFQKVTIHKLDLIRAGRTYNKLRLRDFHLFRTEMDRYRLMFNGEAQLSYVIPDVRPGDLIAFSYTIKGKNSALGPHFFNYFQHEYSVPVHRLYQRMLVPSDWRINMISNKGADVPELTEMGEFNAYTIAIDNRPKFDAETNTPRWYYDYQTTEFSSFNNWSEVGQFFSSYFTVSDEHHKDIQTIVREIKSRNKDKRSQVRAGLDFVQREIRYFGIEIGSGGYVPRAPEVVLKDRFGDCKDMTYLLLYIFKELGVKAYPVLVSTEYKSHIKNLIPSHAWFDHVVVGVEVAGNTYFLDPTIGEQLGDLDHLQQADFGQGLVLSPNSPGLVDIEEGHPKYYISITDTYNLIDHPEHIAFENRSEYFQGRADRFLRSYRSRGREEVEKSELEFYRNEFARIKRAKDSTLQVDKTNAKVTFTSYYTIEKGWVFDKEYNQRTFTTYPYDFENYFLAYSGGERTSPYSIAHPIKVEQTLNFILDDSWEMEEGKVAFSNPAFSYSKTRRFKSNIYQEVYHYSSNSDFISPDRFSREMIKVKDANEKIGVTLYHSLGDVEDKDDASRAAIWVLEHMEEVFVGWFFLAVFLSLIFAILRLNADFAWRSNLVLYPVSMSKFIPLSMVTFGVYQLYWIYKNWQWLRDIEGQKVSAGARAFFALIFNFYLFKKIADMQPRGYAWFQYAALPLAFLYVAGEFAGRVSDKWEGAPIWFDALAINAWVILVPVALQVNKMNEGREEFIQKNSQYGWEAAGLIVLFFPLFALVIIGLFVS